MAPGDPFADRKKSLRKMARELSVLCGVDVALVVAAADGAGVPGAADAWESREGVMARYRALPPEVRARHTHRAYLEANLGNEESKLARVRQAGPVGLRDDAALGLLDGADATAGDARQLLDVIDAAIRAADARRIALGMPADVGGDEVVLEGIAPVSSAAGGVDGGGGDYYVPHPQHGGAGEHVIWPGNAGGGGDYYVPHPQHGGAGEHVIWPGNAGGGFQPFTCGATADIMQPGGYGFQFQEQCATSGGGGAGMEGYYHNLQMAPAMYGVGDSSSSSSSSHVVADAYPYYQVLRHAQPDLAPMWSAAAAEPRHAMVPAEYSSTDTGLSYYNYMVDTPAAPSASLQGNGAGGMSFATGATSASGNFVYDSPPALSLATGNDIGGGGSNFISAPPTVPLANATGGAGGDFTYTTPAQQVSYAGELTDAGWYAAEWQPRRDSGGQEPMEQLHYLSDLEDTQLHLWGN
ncbi:unnamed protein product [Urochloa decumbens]|uniref:MADS-box domain-containing protein n=1 Tax=Urochloa decumbens TaxID=240449 RepID=A0ABC9C1D7_9POAL